MNECMKIREGAILKVWIHGDEMPYGFTDGSFKVDKENGYIEVRTKDGDITGIYFSMFSYIPHPDEEDEEVSDIRGYN